MDFKRISSATGIPLPTIARALFPNHKYPVNALKYVSKGKHGLTDAQKLALVSLTGASIETLELFEAAAERPEGWALRPSESLTAFSKGPYRIDYHPAINTAYIYRNGELVSDHILVSPVTPLSQFLQSMESIIASLGAPKNS